MRKYLYYSLHIIWLLLGCYTGAHAAALVSIKNVTLVDANFNDGDSFKVNAAGRALHLRLYYVDCLETTHSSKADLERIRAQQRHFGLEDPGAVVDFGEQATEYMQQMLSQPFTIYTSYARAPGRSAMGRYYAFVETHSGQDLGHLLVAQGLARVHGKTRPSPDGTQSEIVIKELQDLRTTAILTRAGIWRATNPDLIITLRQQQRADDHEMKRFRKELAPRRSLDDTPLDLNQASSKQLQQISRIGPVTAARIIANRPFQSIQDLIKIPGIGPKTLEAIAPYVTVGGQ